MTTTTGWLSGIAVLEDNILAKNLLPEDSPQIERREHVRVSASIPLKCRTKKNLWWFQVTSINISSGGVRLATPHPMKKGDRLEIETRFPGTKEFVKLEGVVVWTGTTPSEGVKIAQYECGVAFANLRNVTGRQNLIHFMADKLCANAIQYSSKDLACSIAETVEEIKPAFHLIYEGYLPRGYCKEHASKLHYNAYSFFPGTRTFLLKRQSDLLGTLSLIPDSRCGVPMDSLFSDELQKLRDSGRKIAEVGMLALDQKVFKKKGFSLMDFDKMTGSFRLFKLMFDYARSIGITDLIIGMHPKHQDLYAYLMFQAIGEPRAYPGACGRPALLMRMDIAQALENAKGRSLGKYFAGCEASEEELQKYVPWDTASLSEFLFRIKSLWQELSPEYQGFLKSCYPELAVEA